MLPALIAGIIALAAGSWAWLVAVPLLAFSIWHIRAIEQVYKWLRTGSDRRSAPSTHGTADQIVTVISEQRRQQEEQQKSLNELLNRFDAATSAMPDALLIIDSYGVIEWCNAAAEPLLGIDRKRDVGQPIENIVRDPVISSYLGKGDFSVPLEFSVHAEEGNDCLLRVVPYGHGKRLLSVQDHSDLLRLQQIRHSFVSNASHEMRTPLTVIIGYLEALLTRTEGDPSIHRAVSSALGQSQRLQNLVEDLLSLTRLESAPLEPEELDRVEIGALVHEAIEMVKASTSQQQLPVMLSLCDEDFVLGNYRELQSAVSNVIDNAFKHTPAGTPVEIELCREDDSWLVLRVTDRGEGVDMEHIHRLTERFYRVDKGRSRDMGGTGLGLSIVKHVMNRHRGELLIDSIPGEGSTFALRFRAA